MIALGSLAFLAPVLLLALVALPVLWRLLRATPPAPVRRRFPGIALLLGLKDSEREPARTPWWLMLLRVGALALAILGLSQPVLNPDQVTADRDRPLVIALDGGWGSAPHWSRMTAEVRTALEGASRAGQPVHLVNLAEERPDLGPRPANDWLGYVDAMEPSGWLPDREAAAQHITALPDGVSTLWLSSGLGGLGGLDGAFSALGPLTVVLPETTALAIRPPRSVDGALVADVVSARAAEPDLSAVRVNAIGRDASGIERILDTTEVTFEPGAFVAEARFALPLELRNRVTRIALAAPFASAGGTSLTDDGIKRRRIALVAGQRSEEGRRLADPLHYLRTALTPVADLVEPQLAEVLEARPDIVMLVDVGQVPASVEADLLEFIDDGGILVRFAGPRLAASGAGQTMRDPLLPVRLRAGGRSLGGTMSWGDPRRLRPFGANTLFDGLLPPDEVEVSAQVMAQPDPDLAEHTVAALEDGTPLVTARSVGNGQIILFHVTANASWSSLPLSGLFLDMLERISRSVARTQDEAPQLAGATWAAQALLDGRGNLRDVGDRPGIAGEVLEQEVPSAAAPAGLYTAGERSFAHNILRADTVLAPMQPPSADLVRSFTAPSQRDLTSHFLTGAIVLLLIDILATLALGGRLKPGGRAAIGALFVAVASGFPGTGVQAQDDVRATYATSETVLAYVETGDAEVDRISRAGLTGLSLALTRRTAIEPDPPVAVNLERHELAFYPLIYWPITDRQQPLSETAAARVDAYLRGGGMMLIDTRDANLTTGRDGPNSGLLQRLAGNLDLPPLEPIPEDHVLTRAFYLLDQFPGRYIGPPVWAEASLAPETVDGMPFRTLNDGVSPVIIGANDWAAAWAVDETGNFIRPVGRGLTGERQREIALRFGVNLVMYVMTGNYKSDQVHVPALLERLGQ
ncbi:DUF4159 domain-containing protein [Pontivivens insulae]|uniref:DUF4159 domain-containing protein n=1 Tax=Pontivivens insulae TaxID=1639689 RepID=A0A2R8AFK2_9RHOB|nr:DUF4159 domain-containing protein [Pontivivens insulae]RED12266.1 putative membrane protein (TIGR02226 family) [Pontivivens insulae]SPF31023.1 hypothetical protein POI8812_03373 [Pontivivens insulae]